MSCRVLALQILIVLVLTVASSSVFACKCKAETLEHSYENALYVVQVSGDSQWSAETQADPVLSVQKSWKGRAPATLVYDYGYFGMCAVHLEPDRSYILFLYGVEKAAGGGKVYGGFCDHNLAIDGVHSDADVKKFRSVLDELQRSAR